MSRRMRRNRKKMRRGRDGVKPGEAGGG